MSITLIAACDRAGVIGSDSGMPWHLPGDLRRFRQETLGKPIIMGRRTQALIAKPLPGRLNIVLTRQHNDQQSGWVFVSSQEEAIEVAQSECQRTGTSTIMVIGGGEIYRLFFPLADRVHLTIVDGSYTGDVLFPTELFDAHPFYLDHEEHYPPDVKNLHACHVLHLSRQGSGTPFRFESFRDDRDRLSESARQDHAA